MWISKLSVRHDQPLNSSTGEGVVDELVEFDPSCEALIFSSEGVPQHGMSPPPHPSMFDTEAIKTSRMIGRDTQMR